MAEVVLNPRSYVDHWFKLSGKNVRQAQRDANAFGGLYLDYLEEYRVYRGRMRAQDTKPAMALAEKELIYAYNELCAKKASEAMEASIAPLSFNGGTLAALKTWINAVTGKCDSVTVAVMAHWLWQVKRKALRKSVKWQVMPILFGAQGGGKSMAIMALLSPVEDYRLNMLMTSLGDERMYEGLSQNLVVFFDELQNIERTNVNVLKNQITTTTNSYRKLHSHAVITAPMTSSFIGASNKNLNENFSDSTGMRRFYQIDCIEKMDWELINKIDYISLWKQIDENNSEGYLVGELLMSVVAQQQSLVNKEELEVFTEDFALFTKGETKPVLSDQLYIEYQDWAAKSGCKALTKSWFCRKLINMKLPYYESVMDNGSKKKYFKVNVESPVVRSRSLTLAKGD